MPHVLVAGTLHPAGHEVLASAPGVTVEFAEGISEESYAPRLHAADALLLRTQPLGASTIAGAPRLRIVSRHGVGFDAVDVDALTARGVVLAVCGDVNSTSVAEHAMMLMLAATKRALRADGAVRRGAWGWREALEPQDLRGRNLLVVGFGRIGRRIAAMAAGFGLSVRAHDPLLMERGWPEGEVGPVAELREGLAWADIVSLSAPGTGRPLIGTAELAAMRPGAVLVNTARGGLIDEAALVDALRSGDVGAAGLDVFESEPPPPDHPLAAFDQVILSPHVAGLTADAAERMATGSARNILDFFAGRIDPTLVVNRKHLDGIFQA